MKRMDCARWPQMATNPGGRELKNGFWGGVYADTIAIQSLVWKRNLPHRSNIRFCENKSRQTGIRRFSITSPVKRDGKTTVAVNLAATLSLDYEERVLLIDGDLRAPSVHKYFDVPHSPGLTDYLGSSSKMNLKNPVQEAFLPGLRILSSGKPSHLASELLAKERMKQILSEAQAQFSGHRIIIDSPPILRLTL
jgi:Mrp family chromosome partitioning ATPase